MRAIPNVNKVIYGDNTLIDLTSDTVTSDSMLSGTTAHDKSGAIINGIIQTMSANDVTGSGSVVNVSPGYYSTAVRKTLSELGMNAVHYDTTANWNASYDLVGEEGSIYIYSDHDTITIQGVQYYVPGMKVGDGLAYLIDLPFVTEAVLERINNHINNSAIHVSSSDRESWNNKVSSFLDHADNENLVFSKNTFSIGDIYNG